MDDNFRDARAQLHTAAQIPGALARTFVPAEADHGHTTLSWHTASCSLMTQRLGDIGFCGLRMHDLALVWLDGNQVLTHAFPLHDRTLEDGYAFVAQRLAEAGLNTPLDMEAGYTLDPTPQLEGAPFSAGPASEVYIEFATHYGDAAGILQSVAQTLEGASRVRCWPHHFDQAVLHALESGDPEEAKSIGFGFSPGDSSYDEPYWYVTPWPYPEASALPELSRGSWHTDGWIGAVWTLSDASPADVGAFIVEAHTHFLNILDAS